jgi:GNAT superfamily N-acetyltransferase
MQARFEPSQLVVRRATAEDAPAIGAVFDAAVRAGWGYLGDLAQQPMFAPEDWDQLVADHAPPNVLLVGIDQAGTVLGYTAAHPEDCEMFLLFVDPAYAGQGVGRTLLDAAHDAARCRLPASLPVHSPTKRSSIGRLRAGRLPSGRDDTRIEHARHPNSRTTAHQTTVTASRRRISSARLSAAELQYWLTAAMRRTSSSVGSAGSTPLAEIGSGNQGCMSACCCPHTADA